MESLQDCYIDEKINILKYLELFKYLSKNNLYFKLKILSKMARRLLQKLLKFNKYSQNSISNN